MKQISEVAKYKKLDKVTKDKQQMSENTGCITRRVVFSFKIESHSTTATHILLAREQEAL
jgi:hypothetical protein